MKYLKKVLICILLAVVIINFNKWGYVNASLPNQTITDNVRDAQESLSDNNENNKDSESTNDSESRDSVDDLIGSAVDGIVGLILYPMRLIVIVIGTIARTIAGSIAAIGGGVGGEASTAETIFISSEDILFNKIPLTDIDFFNFSENNNGAISSIRKNVAIWYSALRNLAIAILLVVLVYIGIRMTISTVAEQEARYKQMLTDWAVSFALVFLLHYIILAGIYISDSLVQLMDVSRESYINSYNKDSTLVNVNKVMDSTLEDALTTAGFCKGFGSAIVYTILCGVTFVFLVMYIQRMITIAFLIMIAPLITVTYSIDKVKDKKAQALENWLKEFLVNVLIQPFHCVIYLTITVTGIGLMDGSLGGSVLAVLMTVFIFKAEKIIKAIFSVVNGGQSSSDMAWGAAFVASGIGNLQSIVAKRMPALDKSNQNNGNKEKLESGNKKPTINRQSSNTDKALSSKNNTETKKNNNPESTNMENNSNKNTQNNENNKNKNNEKINGINNDISELEGKIQAAEAEGDMVTKDALERQLMKKQVEKSMLINETNQQDSDNDLNTYEEEENKKQEDSYLDNLKKKAKEGAVKNLQWQAKWGSRIGGASLGSSQGLKGMMATAAATEITSRYAASTVANKKTELQNVLTTRKAEKQFAKAYNEYTGVEENKNLSNNRMKDITMKYINGVNENDDNISDADKKYAEYVQDLYNQYKKIGVEDPEKMVIDTVEDIQKKRVVPE